MKIRILGTEEILRMPGSLTEDHLGLLGETLPGRDFSKRDGDGVFTISRAAYEWWAACSRELERFDELYRIARRTLSPEKLRALHDELILVDGEDWQDELRKQTAAVEAALNEEEKYAYQG